MTSNPIIWQPAREQIEATAMWRFMRSTGHQDYDALYAWSIREPAAFWDALCAFCEVQFDTPPHTLLTRKDDIMDAGWFAGSRLNYAAHLLRHDGDGPALVFYGENGTRRELSRSELRAHVASVAAGLKKVGVSAGDRVAGFVPNCPEAVIAMLAATSLGAISSSCSPDFGINGVVDRFGQIEPKVLFAVNGYYYNGKTCDTRAVVEGVVDAVHSIECTVVIHFADDLGTAAGLAPAVSWEEFEVPTSALEFVPVEFDLSLIHI